VESNSILEGDLITPEDKVTDFILSYLRSRDYLGDGFYNISIDTKLWSDVWQATLIWNTLGQQRKTLSYIGETRLQALVYLALGLGRTIGFLDAIEVLQDSSY
jgi:hypothetical protein